MHKLAAFCHYTTLSTLTRGGLLPSVRRMSPLSTARKLVMKASGSDWNPQIVKVLNVFPHSNADALDVVTVLGDYPVIVKKGEYRIGDLAAYIPIDSVVPDTEQYHFLCPPALYKYEENGKVLTKTLDTPRYPVGSVPEKYRVVKARKLRGVYSQGMLMPCPEGLNEAESIVERFNLTKWNEEEEENLRITDPGTEPPPVGWQIPFYDVNGIRMFAECVNENEEIVLAEKIHGSNAAFVHDGTRLWVKSRNFYKRKDVKDLWWDAAIRYNLEKILEEFPRKVFYGEVYGQITRFKYDTTFENGRHLPKLIFFDIFDLDAGKFLDFDERYEIISKCKLSHVPILYRGPWLGKEEMYKYAEGQTTLGGKHVREGWVLIPLKERFEPKLASRMQLKLVSEAYNLQK